MQLQADGRDGAAAAAAMRRVSPKYVPREWLLREAYTAVAAGDDGPLHRLNAVLARPYDEQPEAEAAFYRKAPAGTYAGAGTGGVTHMS